MPYHPETTVIKGLVRVHRERKLPARAVPRPTPTIAGMPVDAIATVLQGDLLRDYRIVDVAAFFKMKDAAQAAELITVEPGQRVQFGQELAERGKGRRTKVMPSPVEGLVVQVQGSQIVLQASERVVEVLARMQGEIEAVTPHAVQITGTGALIQCAWGNGGFAYQAFKFVPQEGFVALSKVDPRISEYRNVVVISPYPITKGDLLVAAQQEAGGVVAPSMPANLREFAMGLTFPVLLTEGFGRRRPTGLIYNLLQSNMGRQAAFDAAVPDRWSWSRPEITIPLPTGGITPTVPVVDQALIVGAQVRITRAPWEGVVGQVIELPPMPQVIESGLRLACARVQLSNARVGLVPLANLELLG